MTLIYVLTKIYLAFLIRISSLYTLVRLLINVLSLNLMIKIIDISIFNV